MKKKNYLAILSLAALLFSSNVLAQTVRSTIINISNIPTNTGKVLISSENRLFYNMVDATGSEVSIELKNLPNGKYKLNVFHDANNNWRLDMANNAPLEYCASVEVAVTDTTTQIPIRLVNVQEYLTSNKNK